MSNNVECERAKEPTDSDYEADIVDPFIHPSSTVIEFYRSYTYSINWRTSMFPRRSYRRGKAAEETDHSPDEEVIQRRFRGKRWSLWQKDSVEDSAVGTDEATDLISLIDSTPSQSDATEDEGKFEVTDRGVDESDDDCVSLSSSISSGPSRLQTTSPPKPRPQQGLCLACKTLYQKAKKMKMPIKSKLLDNNPKSLTCDQWVLLKTWRPKRLPHTRGKLLSHVQLVKKRLKVMNGAKGPGKCEGRSSCCSRPHTFLQRNLRRVPVKEERRRRKNRRKRRIDSSQGPRVTKQQRLHGNDDSHSVCSSPTGSHCSGPSSDAADSFVTVELIPSSVTLEKAELDKTPKTTASKKKSPKRTGFRDLLSKLRANSSMIVRETR